MNYGFCYFDKIYCINLKSRLDRWENCEKQFSQYKIPNVQRFEAVKCNYTNLSKKANSQIGCTLSHYYICKEAKEKKYNRILVLEDDFLFTKSVDYVNDKLNKSILDLPVDWDLFYFGAYFVKGYEYNPVKGYSENLVKVNTGFCTHAISYSLNGINKILRDLKLDTEKDVLSFSEEYEVIDWYLVRNFQYDNKCFAVNELLCEQSDGISDIEDKYFNYHNLFVESYKHNVIKLHQK